MDENIKILSTYLKKSSSNMSSYGKFHLLKNNYLNIEEGMNSGNFIKMNKIRLFKSYISFILQVLIWKKEIFTNEFILNYKKICKKQNRVFNYDLIIHSCVLKLLKKNQILKDNICVIGDGKANFIHGIYNLNKVKKIYSVNLPQALIQDYLILKSFGIIDSKLIKIVNSEKDFESDGYKIFLIPAENKRFLNSKNINLFVNMASFQEMPLSETHAYIEIAKSNSAFLYSNNREEKIMYDNVKIKYSDYGLKKDGTLIFENEPSFYKYFYSSKFPFIHKKDGKMIHSLVKY